LQISQIPLFSQIFFLSTSPINVKFKTKKKLPERKYDANQQDYLYIVKWFDYPIEHSTWEPRNPLMKERRSKFCDEI